MNNEPYIHVGILSDTEINFTLTTPYRLNGRTLTGRHKATCAGGRILLDGQPCGTLLVQPENPARDSFILHAVSIGIGFHWQRAEDQRFRGALQIITEHGKLTAVNIINAEAYLACVIASEMSATAPPELLKAHAVISRSWLLANLKHAPAHAPKETDEEGLVWYERTAHTRYDVCADDHCQRYQGITRATTEAVRQAIGATRGEALTYGGQICDARFSKCCGGAFEEFQYCWDNTPLPYLRHGLDRDPGRNPVPPPDLTDESQAQRWIRSTPPAFCRTTDHGLLARVLNNYDQETPDFYRWHVEYTQEELARLIHRRTGVDYGAIADLVPVARGTSGRLWKMRIVGTRLTRVIGKELEIRRTLSPTHLYSSAFVVDKTDYRPDGLPGRFLLTGAGWGHGVGMCQIGAAVMALHGYGYRDILRHYYAGAQIQRVYEPLNDEP